MRTVVYVDGFNLYYGALKGGPYRWLDLDRYFRLLRWNDQILTIRYFTARIHGAGRVRQDAYLSALTSTPKVNVVLGRYKEKSVRCTVRHCTIPQPREFRVPEEKGTDVHIAIAMLDDAHRAIAERVVLVSGESDLVPVVRTLRLRFPAIQTTVYVPARDRTRGAATELRQAAEAHRTMPLSLLERAQFPEVVHTPSGSVMRPTTWARRGELPPDPSHEAEPHGEG